MPGYISNQGYLNYDANTGAYGGGKVNVYDYYQTLGIKQTSILTPKNTTGGGKLDKRSSYLYVIKNQIDYKNKQVNWLIVGGGGAGGNNWGGGGGGGGVIQSNNFLISTGSYNIVIGTGALASATNGSNTTVIGVDISEVAQGGGTGGFNNGAAAGNGKNGGSGGGAGAGTSSAGTGGASLQSGNSVIGIGSGNKGGNAAASASRPGGGGGGGAGTAGVDAIGTGPGTNGGDGIYTTINGTNTAFGGGGGGGSGGSSVPASAFGIGGAGGGANGANAVDPSSASGSNGITNTGGGGGGGSTNGGVGGSGGSGIVIVNYAGAQTASGGTVTSFSNSTGSYTVHTFTANGTFVF